MIKQLEGILYVCYFRKGCKHINVIDMSDESTVENTGASWCEAAFGNALGSLNISKTIERLYLMPAGSMCNFRPFAMSRAEQEDYLKKYTKEIIVPSGNWREQFYG